MIVFSCSNLKVEFGSDTILDNISVSIFDKDRIGIVGSNGAGKTTFLKLLLGEYSQSSGDIFRCPNLKFGYLSQDSSLESNNNVLDEFHSSFSHLVEIEKRLEAMQSKLETAVEAVDIDKLSQSLSTLYEEYTNKGGLTYKNRIVGILKGLGFPETSWQSLISTLSGGQKTRLALGRLLVQNPDVLILDEPTNHLDIDTLLWLETYLKNYSGTLLVISHDRFFIEAVTTKIINIENKKLKLYPCGYTKYVELKRIDLASQEKNYQMQQNEISRIEDFIEQQRKWNRERNIIAVESRMKMLDRMTLVNKPESMESLPKISFNVKYSGGKDVLFLENLSMSFPNKFLFENLSFDIYKGERVFLKGPNGCGKSSLLKILTNNLSGYSGSFRFGSAVKWSYYSQELTELNPENTVLEEVWEYANKDRGSENLLSLGKIRNNLAAFNFTNEDVFKSVSVLSGGEKARVALLKMTFDESSFLILDEPTNHLDIQTREILEQALLDFEGTLLIVSHDRYFINKLATRIIDLSPIETTVTTGTQNNVSENKLSYYSSKDEKARLRKLESNIKKSEADISTLENRLKEIEIEMSNREIATNHVLISNLFNEKTLLESNLDDALNIYLELLDDTNIV